MLSLILASFSFAADNNIQDTAVGGQELTNALGTLYASQQAAKVQAEALRRRVLDLERAAAAAPAVPAANSGELEAAKAELAAAKAAYEAAVVELEAAQAALAQAQATAIQQVEVRTAGFHPIIFLGGGAVLAGPVPDVSGPVAGRLSFGVRPTWDVADDRALGLVLEGNYALGGWGVRAIPTYLTYGVLGGVGFGAGAGYNCDGLGPDGCLAEHVGGVGRASWEMGGGFAGILLTGDLEVNYLSTPGGGGMETRGILGASVFFGTPRPQTVSIPQ